MAYIKMDISYIFYFRLNGSYGIEIALITGNFKQSFKRRNLMNEVHSFEYRGYTVNIMQDEFNESPREDDNLGTMVCFHSQYDLGDKHNIDLEETKELMEQDDIISLPLYRLDHSGITMNTTGFSCPWDSGQVGFIYISKDDIRKEYKVKKISKKLLDKILTYLAGEVETYDQFLRGEVYGYNIEDSQGDSIDSVWGFYGDYEGYLTDEVKSRINWEVDQSPNRQLILFEEMRV